MTTPRSPFRTRPTTPRSWVALTSVLLTTATACDDVSTPAVNGAALDVHTHLASPALLDFFIGGGLPAADGDELVDRLDQADVDQAVVLSAAYYAVPDPAFMAAENDWIASEVSRHQDRLIGFCGIDPLHEDATDEVDRCLAAPNMVGIKLHLEGSAVDLARPEDVEALDAIMDRAEVHDAPVLIHVADPFGLPLQGAALAGLASVLSGHPKVRVAHAHCAGNTDDQSLELWLRVKGSGYDPETSFVETSACLAFFRDAPFATRERMVWRLRRWGIDRVLFGSDYFQYGDDESPAQALDTLRQYPFTAEELETILTNDGTDWLRGPDGSGPNH